MRRSLLALAAAFIAALCLGAFFTHPENTTPAFAAGQRDTRNFPGNQTSILANESAILRNYGFIYYRDGRPVLANGTTCVVPRAEMDGAIGDALLGQLEPYQMDGLPNCAPYGQVALTPPQPCDIYGNCPPAPCWYNCGPSYPPPPPPSYNTAGCPTFAGYQSYDIGNGMCKLRLGSLVSGYTPSGWWTDYWDGYSAHYNVGGNTWVNGSEFTFKR